MAENSTVNIISYSNTVSDTNSASKSYMDKSSDFSNVFENINKTYSSKDDSSKNISKNADDNKDINNQKPQDLSNAVANKKAENTSNSKSEDKNADKKTDDEEKNSSFDDKTSTNRTDNTNTEDKAKAETDKEVQAKDVKQPNKSKTEDTSEDNFNLIDKTVQISQVPQVPQETQNPAENTEKNNVSPEKSAAENINELSISAAAENIIQTLPAALNTEIADLANKPNTDDAKSNFPKQVQTIQEDFSVDLTQLTQNLKDIIANQSNNAKIEPQAQQTLPVLPDLKVQLQAQQQPLFDLKLNPQNITTQQPQQAQAPQPETAVSQETNIQTPVIAVNTQAIAANTNLNASLNDINTKQDIKEVLSKTSLTQDVLDKTNAKVVSVETSNSSNLNLNSNNLLNQQNTEEQAVKLSMESSSPQSKVQSTLQTSVQNPDLTNIADTTAQAIFAKTLDGIQTQQSKELSKTDILSQIHSQLDNFQEEGTTKVSMVLKPENLGKINLELVNSKEGLTARITTDNVQVKELLDKNLDSLKNSLGNQGVTVNSVTVKVNEAQKQSNDMFSFDNGQSKEGNHGFSNNSQKQNQSEFSLDGEIDNAISKADTESEAEDLVSAGSYAGQVDYKV